MTEPFYQDENCVIYCGDAATLAEELDLEVNLIVTDPPYGQGFVSGKNTHAPIHGDDGSVDVRAIMDRTARRFLARGRHAYVFGPIDLAGTCLTAQTEIIWDKESVGMGDLQSPWGLSHERITFAVQEISAANRAKGYGNLSARIRKGSVIRATKRTGDAAHRHPTEKPVSVLRQLIESSSVMGETVLDPFMGSGSTLEAAFLEGRKAIGFEIDPEHCRKAADRMRRFTNQAGRDDCHHTRKERHYADDGETLIAIHCQSCGKPFPIEAQENGRNSNAAQQEKLTKMQSNKDDATRGSKA